MRAVFVISLLLAACPTTEPTGDDDSALPDDDDATATPPPLGETIGIVNLTRIRQDGAPDWVDLSGVFADWATLGTELSAPGAYLGSFGYEAPYWRWDMGAWPNLPLGEERVEDLFAYLPWEPADTSFWDAGPRLTLGPWLSLQLVVDNVIGYQVEDPLVPGSSGWGEGGVQAFGVAGGADVVAWDSAPDVRFPALASSLLQPAESPAARDLPVAWEPGDDGATVSIAVLRGLGPAYLATVDDDGEHTIAAAFLHDGLGAGEADLVVARTIESTLPHPQGDILVRVRDEVRNKVRLLPDVVFEPGSGDVGTTVDAELHWYTGEPTDVDLGDGITVGEITVDPGDPSHLSLTLTIDADADVGPRPVTVSDGTNLVTVDGLFTVTNVAPADTCADAAALDPLPDGDYASTTVGLANDFTSGWACLDWTLNSSDVVYPIELDVGETLIATLDMPAPSDGALVLLADCADTASAVACADAGFDGDEEQIVFTSDSASLYWLVVDGYRLGAWGADASPFGLTILRPQPSAVQPPWIVPGTTRTLTITGESSWSVTDVADVALGASVAAQSVGGAGTTALTVSALATPGAAPGPRDVTVDDPTVGEVTFPSALWVTDLPSSDTCAAADAWGPVGAVAAASSFVVAAADDVPDAGCFTWGTVGGEVFFALDLVEGELLDVSIESAEDTQIYLLTDCADAVNACAVGADAGLLGEPEAIVAWPVPATGRYYLAVDRYDAAPDPYAAWGYTLTVGIGE